MIHEQQNKLIPPLRHKEYVFTVSQYFSPMNIMPIAFIISLEKLHAWEFFSLGFLSYFHYIDHDKNSWHLIANKQNKGKTHDQIINHTWLLLCQGFHFQIHFSSFQRTRQFSCGAGTQPSSQIIFET